MPPLDSYFPENEEAHLKNQKHYYKNHDEKQALRRKRHAERMLSDPEYREKKKQWARSYSTRHKQEEYERLKRYRESPIGKQRRHEAYLRMKENPEFRAKRKTYNASHKAEISVQGKIYRSSRKEEIHFKNLKQNYGLTRFQVFEILQRQNFKCPICELPIAIEDKDRVPDHDHDSKIVRGFLHNLCNQGLGCFKEDPKRFLNAISYLGAYKIKKEVVPS